jgi:cyclophilin family peptidyl-prolyl cis-trans isomerase
MAFGALAVLLTACQGGGGQGDAARPAGEAVAPDPTPTIVLETTQGRIVMELDREKAPITVDNFVAHVRIGFYNGLTFHRVRPGFMIQAGKYTAEMQGRSSSVGGITNEADNGLSNMRGTVAMARLPDPHSATTQFFINVVDNQKLDYGTFSDGWGYAVFGRVVDGLDVVDAIVAVPARRVGRHEALPVEPVVITSAYVAEEEETSP